MKLTIISPGNCPRIFVVLAAFAAVGMTTRPSWSQNLEEPFTLPKTEQAGGVSKSTPTTPHTEALAEPSTSSIFLQTVPNATAAESAPVTAVQSTDSEYVLSSSDAIEMTVFREPDLTTRATISRDGTVQFPLINDVKVAGLTIKQARNLIRARYNADYLVEPQVSLSVTKFAERKFTIIGQVNSPGTYTLSSGDTLNLMQAIGMAGGFTRIADRRNIIVKRAGEGGGQTFKFNAKKMTESSGAPFQIAEGDVISIGESWY